MDDENKLSQTANSERQQKQNETSIEDTVDLSETKSQEAANLGNAETGPSLMSASSPLQPSTGNLRYHVLRQHAKGGLGEVFVARDSELNREVALKEIQKHHADDPGSRSRFLLEAEVTGGLEHPGIVPVYGLGRYNDGRPYYAMRFIRGDSLKEAVDRFHAGSTRDLKQPMRPDSTDSVNAPEQLSEGRDYTGRVFRKLLGRFIDVCNAIEYAHSRGVLHRDLKPGNVMLGKYGETLVVDWGLAKVQGQDKESEKDEEAIRPASGSSVEATRMGNAVGTPAFMPPEQAAGRLDELGPTSDVYSLGATLYYVLTGQPPFRGKNINQLLAQVQNGDFKTPREVRANIPKPLEAICLRAMATQPQDRYASPQALAVDAERYLADEAVDAHQEPLSVRALRWLRKHPKSVSALAATVLVGMISSSVIAAVVSQNAKAVQSKNDELDATNLKLVRKNEELQLAYEAQHQAKADALAVNEFFQHNVLARARPKGKDGGLGISATIRDAVDAAEPLIAESFADRPLVEAAIRDTLGLTYWHLGELESTIRQHEIALNLRKSNLGQVHGDTLISMNQLALAYKTAGRLEEALPIYETTLRRMKEHLGPEHVETIQAMNNLAVAYGAAGRPEKAISFSEETLRLTTSVLGPMDPSTLNAMNNLAMAFQAAGRVHEAMPIFERTLKLRTSTLGPDHPDTLMSANNLAGGYADVDRWDDALPIYEETLEQRKVILGPEHIHTLSSMDNLASAYGAKGRQQKALLIFKQTLDLKKKKLGLDHPETLISMNNLAVAYREAGRLSEALPIYEETLKLRAAKLGPQHPNTLNSMNNLANAFKEAGRLDEAVPLYEKTLRLRTENLGPKHPSTLSSLSRLAGAYRSSGRLDDALPIYEKTLELRTQVLGPHHRKTLLAMNNLALAYMQAGKLDDALPLHEQSAALLTTKLGRDHPSTLVSMNNLALAYLNAGRFDDALPIYIETLELRKSKLGLDHPQTLLSMHNLAHAYLNAGSHLDALPLFEETLKLRKLKLGPDHPDTFITMQNLALAFSKAGRLDDAIPIYEEMLKLRESKQGPDDPKTVLALGDLAQAYLSSGDPSKGMPLFERFTAAHRRRAKRGDPEFPSILANLSFELLRSRQYAAAEDYLRECLEIRKATIPGNWKVMTAQSMLGEALVGQKKFAVAEPLLIDSYRALKETEAQLPDNVKFNISDAIRRLIQLYSAWEKPEEAKKWQAELKARKDA